MGHPPAAVTLPSPAYAHLAAGVERITAWWGARPADLAAVLRNTNTASPSGPDQLAAIAWVLDPPHRHVLLVDHRSYGWSCPGGHVEWGESPATAAARELAEETGLALPPPVDDPVTLTLVDAPADDDGPVHRHWILGYAFVADPTAPLAPERDPVAWHAVDALPTPAVADLPALLAAIIAT